MPFNHTDEKILARVKAQDPTLTALSFSRRQLNESMIGQLAELLRHNTHITDLDLSYNPQISSKSIQRLNACTSLRTLNLSNTGIRVEHLSHFAGNLTQIDFSNRPMTGADFAVFLKKNPQLKKLNLEGCGLTLEDIAPLANSTQITTLHLSYNVIGDSGVRLFEENKIVCELFVARIGMTAETIPLVLKMPHLHTLDISQNGLTDAAIVHFSESKNIKTLFLRGNDVQQISDEGAKILAKTQIEKLYLEKNRIGDVGVTALASNIHLRVLDLSDNFFGLVGAQKLSENNTLEELRIRHVNGTAGLGDEGVTVFRNTPLTFLDVSFNKLTAVGAAEIAKNRTITTLKIGENPIGAQGICALMKNVILSSIDLRSVPLVTEHKIALNGMKGNTTLTHIDVANCGFSGEAESQITDFIRRNKQLLNERRRVFELVLLNVLCGYFSLNKENASFFATLPLEMILYICHFAVPEGEKTIQKKPEEIYRRAELMADSMSNFLQGKKDSKKEEETQPKPSKRSCGVM